MSERERDELAQRMGSDETVDRLLRMAVRRALLRHKSLGNSVAVWKDGRPVWLAAHEITIDER